MKWFIIVLLAVVFNVELDATNKLAGLDANYEIYGCQDPYVKFSGVYHMRPRLATMPAFQVYCDQTTDAGGWVVLLRRFDGSVDFTRNWRDYRNGFGNINGEYWLGLEKIHQITRTKDNYELLVAIVDVNGTAKTARYGQFAVHSEYNQYRLHVEVFINGTAADCLHIHNRRPFFTFDREDANGCAAKYASGWWFDNCYTSNLNGQYKPGANNTMSWHWNPAKRVGLREARMMIRLVKSSVRTIDVT